MVVRGFLIIALVGCGGSHANKCEAVADDNPCTIETCVDDMPAVDFAPAATTCGTGLSCDGAGNCVQCTMASQCPGSDDECQTRACASGGMCGFSYATTGTPRTQQTAGDCQRNVCDGAGGTSAAIDDADVPADDGNPCTTEVCTQGIPAHPSVAVGTTCGSGLKCNGDANCVECIDATDCPATGNECVLRSCAAQGTCGTTYAPSGTPLATQTPGDCQLAVCNGQGGPGTQDDNSDTPADDGNPCTSDSCVQGVPAHDFLPSGTTCAIAKKCDGGGNCVECVVADDCGTASECAAPFCGSDGTCGVLFTPLGTSCGTKHCDGNGNCI